MSASSLAGTFHFQYEYMYKSLHYEQPPAGVEPFSAALFKPEGQDQREFYVSGVLPDSRLLSFVDESGAKLSTDQIIITKPLANKLKVQPGDSVTLVRKLDGTAFSLTIDRIADTYAGKYIFMPLERYNETFGFPQGSYLGLWSPTSLDIPESQLYSKKSIEETLAALKDSMATIQAMIVAYAVVAFLIGVIVIYLVTAMVVEENKTSISLMKIFGYRKKEVNALVLDSSTIVVVIGYILGVPLILGSIGGLLQALDNSVGITLPVRINPLYILVGFVVVMVSYELSKWMCRKKVDAVPMSEALKLGME
jgi:putative ABC transport system permease protein